MNSCVQTLKWSSLLQCYNIQSRATGCVLEVEANSLLSARGNISDISTLAETPPPLQAPHFTLTRRLKKLTASRCHLQHHQAGEVGEGVVRYGGDAVQRQRQGLEVGLVPQRAHRDLGQVVVVQPQVAQLLEALETVVRDRRDVVGVQAAAGGV